MLFNSLQFAFFFIAVVFLYYALPHRYRWVLLLSASCWFYMAFVPRYILILGFLILSDYILALCIERAQGQSRKVFLLTSVVANIGVLAFFKYVNLFNATVAHFASAIHWNYSTLALSIVLPLGLSFHVFQSLSYVIEVYNGRYRAERHFGLYALYVMFFPQLVAGPIERPQQLLPQLHEEHRFNEKDMFEGLTIMLIGYFKKLVIADGLALLVDKVFANLRTESGLIICLGLVAFAFQLYGDFSGYSDIAVGTARVFGINLVNNFDRPYSARSIAEFWRRWHISLYSWFRIYVYRPIVFSLNRGSRLRVYAALLFTFALSGLWHGAGWTYVGWGVLHGVYLVVGQATKSFRENVARRIRLDRVPQLRTRLQQATTFTLVCVSWILFRSASHREVLTILSRIWTGWGQVSRIQYLRYEVFTIATLGLQKAELLIIALSIVVMEILQMYQSRAPIYHSLSARPWWLRWGFYYALTTWILLFGYFSQRYFVYFQF